MANLNQNIKSRIFLHLLLLYLLTQLISLRDVGNDSLVNMGEGSGSGSQDPDASTRLLGDVQLELYVISQANIICDLTLN